MPKIREKPQIQDVKSRKSGFVPKTSGDLMKIKVMKAMNKDVRSRKALIDTDKIKFDTPNEKGNKVINFAEIKVKKNKQKIMDFARVKRQNANNYEKSAEKSADFSNSRNNFKQKFRKSKIMAKKSAKIAVKTMERTSNAMIKTADNSQNMKQLSIAETATQMQDKIAEKMKNYAKQKAIRKMQKQINESAKKTAVQTAKVAYKSAKFAAKQIATAMVKLAQITIASIGGGGFLVSFIAIFAIVACVIASPFGIFFSGEDKSNPDVIPISAVVGSLNTEFSNKLEQIQDSVAHDSVTIDGEMADMTEVLAIFAVKYATENDVVTIDRARVEQIKSVFWDMNSISYDIEVIEHTDDEGNSWTETILHLHIHHKTEQEMREIYAFNAQQNEALGGILEYRSVLLGLIGSLNEIQGDAGHWIDMLPADLPVEKRKIVETACSLVGKVSYFWGGKYSQFGWCSDWGQLKLVSASGSKTTGTYRPYGLDCSGFVSWVFVNASGNLGASSIIGEGTNAQWNNATEISWSDAQIGDLVFYGDLSHVGIIIGFDMDGDAAICHCASGQNNVVITGTQNGNFSLIARPDFSMF